MCKDQEFTKSVQLKCVTKGRLKYHFLIDLAHDVPQAFSLYVCEMIRSAIT